MSLLGQVTDFNNGIFNNDYAAKIIFDNEYWRNNFVIRR